MLNINDDDDNGNVLVHHTTDLWCKIQQSIVHLDMKIAGLVGTLVNSSSKSKKIGGGGGNFYAAMQCNVLPSLSFSSLDVTFKILL